MKKIERYSISINKNYVEFEFSCNYFNEFNTSNPEDNLKKKNFHSINCIGNEFFFIPDLISLR